MRSTDKCGNDWLARDAQNPPGWSFERKSFEQNGSINQTSEELNRRRSPKVFVLPGSHAWDLVGVGSVTGVLVDAYALSPVPKS